MDEASVIQKMYLRAVSIVLGGNSLPSVRE